MRANKAPTITAVVLAVVAVLGGVYWQLMCGPIAFEHSVWLRGEASPGSPRLRMADGLLRSEVLSGMSRSEVEALLGPPTVTDTFMGSGLGYWLGPERGFIRIDSEWLTLHFDRAGKVSEVRIVTD
ncbi:MAG TPA: outer membrane protein assembly factor BamE [Lysobacter sp.]